MPFHIYQISAPSLLPFTGTYIGLAGGRAGALPTQTTEPNPHPKLITRSVVREKTGTATSRRSMTGSRHLIKSQDR